MSQLLANRSLKRYGGFALFPIQIAKLMPVKLGDLQARCNVTTFAVIVHGEWSQSFNPWYFMSSKGVGFLETVLGMVPEKFVSQLESYSTLGLRGAAISLPLRCLVIHAMLGLKLNETQR
jgi:hypothetical protein